MQRGLLQLSELLGAGPWVDASWSGWRDRNAEATEIARHWWPAVHANVAEEARARAIEVLEAERGDALAELHLAFALCRSGRYAEAQSILGPRRNGGGESVFELALRALSANGAGEVREARECWLRLQESMDANIANEPAEIQMLFREVRVRVGL